MYRFALKCPFQRDAKYFVYEMKYVTTGGNCTVGSMMYVTQVGGCEVWVVVGGGERDHHASRSTKHLVTRSLKCGYFLWRHI